MATESVRAPGSAPASMIVAPNSPMAREKPSTVPASRPRRASGRLTVQKTRQGRAPSVAAMAS